MRKFRDWVTGLICVLISSAVLSNLTLLQTPTSAFAILLATIVSVISARAAIMGRTKPLAENQQERIMYALVACIIFFNMAGHTSYLTTWGQSSGFEFIGETDTPITLDGQHYRLLWKRTRWLSDSNYYELYQRDGIFYHRVNQAVITYSTGNQEDMTHSAVWVFTQRIGIDGVRSRRP